MSNHAIEVSADKRAKDAQFLEERKSGPTRYIVRHSLQARLTHGITVISCLWLCLSGLFVFCRPLGELAGPDVVWFFRMSHRVIGFVFIGVPLISALLAPKGVLHIVKNLFHSWDSDDKKWMLLFMPYLFMAKWIHMPDQGEVKSGQRFADGMLWVSGFLMAITGVLLIFGGTGVREVCLLLHDIGFFLVAVFGAAHIFLGGGFFQPYKGSARLMFGNGMVSEADALYHWGHWAREEIEKGENIVEIQD